ncbi:MAG: hypothetical protein C0483_10980 [Pirellula sp.]|nr:hypothetical protein [Pirellula sp.]
MGRKFSFVRIRLGTALAILAMAMLATSAVAAPPKKSGVVYEIFVRSFADGSDTNRVGDFQGIIDKLDYLNDGDPDTSGDLEVDIIWLMPIFPATDYHGYDIEDFKNVSPDYGTMTEFEDLVKKAHHRGMRIILDLPLNHSSNKHPWFLSAISAPGAPFRDFYHIDKRSAGGIFHSVPGAPQFSYRGLFSPTMPDFNFYTPQVRKELKDIAGFWLDKEVDGFRLDAAKHIYESYEGKLDEDSILQNNEWWREFSEFVYGKNPDAVLIGEVLGDPGTLTRHAWGLDGLVDEPFQWSARDQAAFPKPGFLGNQKNYLDGARAVNKLSENDAARPTIPKIPFRSFLYLASHDANPRLASQLEDKAAHGMTHSPDEAYRMAACLMLTLGERTILYQGDEVKQIGWKWNGNPPSDPMSPGDGSGIYDETLREPFPWTKSSAAAPDAQWQNKGFMLPKFDRPNDGISVEEENTAKDMLALIRGLTNLRTDYPELVDGEISNVFNDSGDWMVFERTHGGKSLLILINTTDAGRDYKFHNNWLPQFRSARPIFFSDGKAKTWERRNETVAPIADSVFVPPYGMVVLKP